MLAAPEAPASTGRGVVVTSTLLSIQYTQITRNAPITDSAATILYKIKYLNFKLI